jgi:hypothetical protein
VLVDERGATRGGAAGCVTPEIPLRELRTARVAGADAFVAAAVPARAVGRVQA